MCLECLFSAIFTHLDTFFSSIALYIRLTYFRPWMERTVMTRNPHRLHLQQDLLLEAPRPSVDASPPSQEARYVRERNV